MEDSNKKNLTENEADALKVKYGKVYRVSISVPVDDDSREEFTYHFKRPSVPSYDRYIKTMSKVGATAASKAFLLDAVVDENRDRLTADMEDNPGIALAVGNKLTELLGLTDSVNLKQL